MGRRRALAGPYPPLGQRVAVGGVSGTGKTTVAKEVARRLGAPHVELDAFAHQAGWRMAEDAEFRAAVDAATAGDTWVADGNYAVVRDIVWERATTFVWLDFPRGVATWRAARRTIPRLVRGHELWNGNRERWRDLLDPGHPVWWSWTHHEATRASYEAMVADPRYAHVAVIRLRSPREADDWLRYAAQP